MVHPSMGVRDFQGFMAKVKAKPGDYSVGVPGLGTLGHLMMASFNETLKTDIQIVPYRGNGPALNDALAGMVQVMADQLPSAMPHIKGGKVNFKQAGALRGSDLENLIEQAKAYQDDQEA